MLKKSLPVLLVTLLVLSLLGIKYYPELQGFIANNNITGQEITHDTNKTGEAHEEPEETKKEHRDKIKPEQFPFETKGKKNLLKNIQRNLVLLKKCFIPGTIFIMYRLYMNTGGLSLGK